MPRFACIGRVATVFAIAALCLAVCSPALAFTVQQIASFPNANSDLIVADIDGDDKDDLVVGVGWGGTVKVQYGLGGGQFTAWQSYYIPPMQSDFTQMDWGDLNGDGFADIVLASRNGTGIAVLPGTAARAFGEAFIYSAGGGLVAVGDLNGNGKDDIITPGWGGTSDFAAVGVILDPDVPNPSPQPPPMALYRAHFQGITGLAVGHFNAGSNLDVAVAGHRCEVPPPCQPPESGVMTFDGNGDGTLGSVDAGSGLTTGHFTPISGAEYDAFFDGLLARPLRGLTRDDLVVTNPVFQSLISGADGQTTPVQRIADLRGSGGGDRRRAGVERTEVGDRRAVLRRLARVRCFGARIPVARRRNRVVERHVVDRVVADLAAGLLEGKPLAVNDGLRLGTGSSPQWQRRVDRQRLRMRRCRAGQQRDSQGEYRACASGHDPTQNAGRLTSAPSTRASRRCATEISHEQISVAVSRNG